MYMCISNILNDRWHFSAATTMQRYTDYYINAYFYLTCLLRWIDGIHCITLIDASGRHKLQKIPPPIFHFSLFFFHRRYFYFQFGYAPTHFRTLASSIFMRTCASGELYLGCRWTADNYSRLFSQRTRGAVREGKRRSKKNDEEREAR